MDAAPASEAPSYQQGLAPWSRRLYGIAIACVVVIVLINFIPYAVSVIARETLYLNSATADQIKASDTPLAKAQNVNSGVPLVLPANADVIRRGYDLSLDNWPNGRVMRQKALLDLRLARHYLADKDAAVRKQGVTRLGEAQYLYLRSVEREPLNQFAWANLAFIFTWTPGPSIGSALALERSWRSGPSDRLLWPLRIELGWRNYDHLSAAGKDHFRREMNAVWDIYAVEDYSYTGLRERLIALAEDHGDLRIMRDLIGETKGDIAMFDAIVGRRAANKSRRNRNR